MSPKIIPPKRRRSRFVNKAVKIVEVFENTKRKTQSRLFWGRSNFYRNIIHVSMFLITIFPATFGIATRFFAQETSSNIKLSAAIAGTSDILEQGGSIQTVLLEEISGGGLTTKKHTVLPGESLDSIASLYNVSGDTIRWASKDVMSPFTDRLEAGWVLTIPEINGVLYTVKPGQTLDDVIAETSSAGNTEANRFNIIEFNSLKEPVQLQAGQVLFVPDGNLRQAGAEGTLADIPRGVFIDPLSHPACAGYTFSRGFLPYHNGVDLAKWDGCPIVAVANGVVEYAGWGSGGQGYYVRVDHGGGIKTEYFHGNGVIWVQEGESVKQGQDLLYMGCTGYCTGTHLHFILWKDKVAINPRPYVPYIGDY